MRPHRPTPTVTAPPSFPALPLPTERGDLFAGSGACGVCSTGLVDGAGNGVSIDTAWRSTMMANAARYSNTGSSVAYRWAENLGRWGGSEVARFLEFYSAVPNLPVVVARGSAVVTP
ncbi:MAG TPA: hypothetical protein EYH30_07595 [Anaerolineales bacterium]|nr:hypothetical protein [Anaerolineae bacterium]HIQ01980.1 hypothetical protein [Anaerolineales bacterium]